MAGGGFPMAPNPVIPRGSTVPIDRRAKLRPLSGLIGLLPAIDRSGRKRNRPVQAPRRPRRLARLQLVAFGQVQQAFLGEGVGPLRNRPHAGGMFPEIIVVRRNDHRLKAAL